MQILHTSIFDSPAQTLTAPVNTVGVMGAGLARAFRDRFPPEMEAAYRLMCRIGALRIGHPAVWKPAGDGKQVLFFPTKEHWRDASRLEDIEAGLEELANSYVALGIQSLALPALGCGLGRLDIEDVRPLMAQHLDPLPIPVMLHLPPAET